jgi:hypothetical protein
MDEYCLPKIVESINRLDDVEEGKNERSDLRDHDRL